jgi:eukaryotic-like serine/threonine-protein kinase
MTSRSEAIVTAIEIPTPDPRTFDADTRPFAEAVASRYAVKRVIGRGGMGIVYLARDRRLDRLVAIKTLPPHLSSDSSLRERFIRETRTAGSMAHPNVVPIHGADEIDGHVFFVMAYVEGDSLAAHVKTQTKLPPLAVARYLRDVAAALSHAHQRGIIHRDIKAENILIERATDRALVTDFGIARFADATPMTATGQVLGTVYYVSPEQVSGETIDARSDIYSLGVVGFLALTGRFPFDAEVASAVLVAHVLKQAPTVASVNRDVPPALAAVIDRCMAKEPARRYASADELLNAIDNVVSTLSKQSLRQATNVVISESEAAAVWQRAAELQASTGIVPRPEPIARARDTAKDRGRGAGFNLVEVRDAANEAGIDERYVEHALVEHGLMPGRMAAPTRAEFPTQRPSRWAGAPLKAVRDIEIEGEIPGRDLESLINTLRDESGRLGHTNAKTRELGWWTGGFGNRLEVTVVPNNGRTHIRITRGIRRNAIVVMVGSLAVFGFMGGGAIGAILGEGMGMDEFGAFIGVASGIAMFWSAGRALARRVHRRASDRVRALGETLTAKVRERLE